MNRALWLMFAVAAATSGCGDDLEPPGLTPDQLFVRLRALPGVTVVEQPTEQTDARYFVLQFTQPVDHSDPAQGTFQQEVSLLHRNTIARVPMIVHTTGYADYQRDQPVELTRLLGANQVSIEHRFFGESRPVPTDWSKLTIEQAAADEHEIIAALRTIYGGAFVATGGSKGGMTAVFHRRFYPEDVDGTVAYVAPISFDAPDERYVSYLEGIGPLPCRQAVRDVAVELLARRRNAMCAHAEGQTQHSYTRIPVGPAVEAAIVSLEWTFWQYAGVDQCQMVPQVSANDDALWAFLERVSPVSDNDDAKIAFFEAYYYQAYAQLGYPDGGTGYLVPYLYYDEEDYANELPVPEPDYDREPMLDILDFVMNRGDRLLFIYGEWDPWSGGKFPLGKATNSATLIQERGTHGTQLASLSLSDREEAFVMLQQWTGVAPVLPRAPRAAGAADGVAPPLPLAPRMPPALVRALHARK